MPIPLLAPLLIGGASTAINTAANLFNRNRRRNYDADIAAYLASLGHSIDIGAYDEAGIAGQQGAQNAAAHGVTGGGASQIVGQYQAPVFAAAAREKAGAASDAQAWKIGMQQQDNADQNAWRSDLIGSITSGIGDTGQNVLGAMALNDMNAPTTPTSTIPQLAATNPSNPRNMVTPRLGSSLQYRYRPRYQTPQFAGGRY